MSRPLLSAPFGGAPRRGAYPALVTRSSAVAGHAATLALFVTPLPSTSVSVTAQDAQHRISVAVTASNITPAYFKATRQYAGIVETVRGDDPDNWDRFIAFGPSRTLFDYEAPRGFDVTYVVTAVAANGTAAISEVSLPAQLVGGGVTMWAHPLSRPGDTVEFVPEDQPTQTYAVSNAVFQPIGRADPIVLFGPRHTPTGSLLARATDYANAADLRATFAAQETLVIRAPFGAGWGDYGRRYVAADTLTVQRLAPVATGSPYDVDLPWIEVAPPDVPVEVFAATWQDVINGVATWQAVINEFPTWDALIGWTP